MVKPFNFLLFFNIFFPFSYLIIFEIKNSMCFYFGLPTSAIKVSKRYNKPFVDEILYNPSEKFNGFAHPLTAVITADQPDVISFASWGLLPRWAKDLSFRKNTLNARIETIETLPSFKDSLSNRCMIPASCYYDWRTEGKTKIPYSITDKEQEIFSFAGIYTDSIHPETKAIFRTYSIITTQANELMQYVHNLKHRMPIVLHPEDESLWLQGDTISRYAFPYTVSLEATLLTA